MDKGYMNETELTAYWGFRPKTLQRWRSDGRGQDYVKFGKCVRYSLSAITAFEMNHLAKRRPARPPIAQDVEPPTRPVEVKLSPEQETVLARMHEFLGSTRSEPMRS